jgi:hypothetical protein
MYVYATVLIVLDPVQKPLHFHLPHEKIVLQIVDLCFPIHPQKYPAVQVVPLVESKQNLLVNNLSH